MIFMLVVTIVKGTATDVTVLFYDAELPVLVNKQENIGELSSLISMACGKDMQIKYVENMQNQVQEYRPEDDIQKLANESNIPFNIM